MILILKTIGMCLQRIAYAALFLSIAVGIAGCNNAATDSESSESATENKTAKSPNESENAKSPGKLESPQAAFAAAKEAALNNDYQTFVKCWTPQGQKEIAAGMVFVGNIMRFVSKKKGAEGKKKAEKITELMKKHGFPNGETPKIHLDLNASKEEQKKEMLKVIEPLKKPTAFAVEMMSLLQEISGKALLSEDAKVVELQTTENSASGTLVQTRQGKEARSPIRFESIGGQWKIAEVPKLMNPGGN